MFYHSITQFVFLMNILGKRSDLPFSRKSDRKEKSTVSFTHVQNIICSHKQLDGIAHEQTIICRSRGGLLANEKKEKFSSNDKAPYLSPKILHKHCPISLGTAVIPKRNKKQRLCKIFFLGGGGGRGQIRYIMGDVQVAS